MTTVLTQTQKIENGGYFFEMLKSLDLKCKSCAPITPLECITRCKVHRLKNELRCLRKTLDNPDYVKDLFNVLKNPTRLVILQVLLNGRYSVNQLQLELKKTGCLANQNAVIEEYLPPLTALDLVSELQDEYSLTLFGSRLANLLGCFPKYAQKLPTHSECYEEAVLQYLLSGPKTFEQIETVVLPKNVSRTLRRLNSDCLINAPTQRDYVFFFRTIRSPDKENINDTERKIHKAIPQEGIPAGQLAEKTGFSKSVIYRNIKHLRSKKLVFQRRTPKTYHLTIKGEKLATVLTELQQTVGDTWLSFQQAALENAKALKIGDLT